MKTIRRVLIFALAALLSVFSLLLAGCGDEDIVVVSVKRCYVNDDSHAIVEFSNGTVKDLGEVRGNGSADPLSVTATYLDERSHLMVRYSDGTESDLGAVAAQSAPSKTISRTYVGEDYHLIVEYSDGGTEDLGYVGVEVTEAEYVVRFWSGQDKTQLLSEKVIKDGEVPAEPAAPTVAGKKFAGWSSDLSSISADTDVWPLYSDIAVYTVRFLDHTGAVIKTQKVEEGKSATAPAAPAREDYIFTGWSRAYTNVRADIDVTANYREAKTFTVRFNDYSGVLLGTVDVKEGKTATAPVTPTREGYKFTGWSGTLANITANKTLTAQYSFNGGTNVLDVEWKLNADGTLTATLSMKGTVSFLGMDGSIKLPANTELVGRSDGQDMLSNVLADGSIKFSFSSSTGRNVTAQRTLLTLNIKPTGGAGAYKLLISVEDFYDEASLADPSITFALPKIIGATVTLK